MRVGIPSTSPPKEGERVLFLPGSGFFKGEGKRQVTDIIIIEYTMSLKLNEGRYTC